MESSSKLQDELSSSIKEKDQVISSLNAKVECLDRKLNHTEHESEKKANNLKGELNTTKHKCEVLEKEMRAVREARQEEVNHRSAEMEDKEELLRQKDSEVSSLQQELKRILQMSMTSSLCNESQTASEMPNLKKENEEQNRCVEALHEQIRQKQVENESLENQVTNLKSQLEKLSLFSSDKADNTSQRKALQSKQSCSIVEVENVNVIAPTPTPRSRSTRKTKTPVVTPLELDTTSEDFDLQSSSTARSKSSRPQRASRRLPKPLQDGSFEYNVSY